MATLPAQVPPTAWTPARFRSGEDTRASFIEGTGFPPGQWAQMLCAVIFEAVWCAHIGSLDGCRARVGAGMGKGGSEETGRQED